MKGELTPPLPGKTAGLPIAIIQATPPINNVIHHFHHFDYNNEPQAQIATLAVKPVT